MRSCDWACTPARALLCGNTCVCHLPGWNIRDLLNIGNILKIEPRQVGALCLLLHRLLIWPVLICIRCFICSHHFVNLHFTLGNHGLILPSTPRQHPKLTFHSPILQSYVQALYSWSKQLQKMYIWIVSCDSGSVYESTLVLSGRMGHGNSICLFRHCLNLSPNLPPAGKPGFSLASVLPLHILCPMICAVLCLPSLVFLSFSSCTGWCGKKSPVIPCSWRWCP